MPFITSDFPGGNILVSKVSPDRIWLEPDQRHLKEGHKWFYWSFRATNTEPVTVTFSHRNYVSAHGPAVSLDEGKTWQWMGREKVTVNEDNTEFSFVLPPAPEGRRYAFCPQYQESHLQEWLGCHCGNPALRVSELCKSRNGRSVELLVIQDPVAPGREILWLTARHHCCESMASYVLEGLLEAALGDDAVGRKIRSRWTIYSVPFMDKDGVEEGDQGKNRHPHDHNRDYTDSPIYPEVRAAMQFLKAHGPAVSVVMDLHCPMVHGPWDNRFYAVGSHVPQVAQGQVRYMEQFNAVCVGPIKPYAGLVLHYGTAWNADANFSDGKAAARWGAENLPNPELVVSFEVPYANAEGVEVNPRTARDLGCDLARALAAL